MSKTIELEWRGDKELLAKLKSIESKVEKQISKKAARSGGTKYARELKKAIPLGPPNVHLRESIGVATPKGRQFRDDIRVQVGVKGIPRYYAHIFEFGNYLHQGTRTFTRTLETNAQAILDQMAKRLKTELDKL